MIVTQTPFRITLGGGGTDLPAFYTKHGGMIFALGINKHMFVAVNRPPLDAWIRLKYHKNEKASCADQIEHDLAREALKLNNIDNTIEIASLADFPAGTGLGSSGCYLVGLLNALRHLRGEPCSPQELAEEACHIELDILKKPVGKQDQYMAAFGGLTYLEIAKDGKVDVKSVEIKNSSINELISNMHLYYTGVKRDATEILSEQNTKMLESGKDHKTVEDSLLRIKEIGYNIMEALKAGNIDKFGILCDEHWQNKLKLSKKIAIPGILNIYNEAKERFGVLGGKISGAGGGGFLMLYAPKNHLELTKFMAENRFKRVDYSLSESGSNAVSIT